jgi:ribosomal-protein-alanine N-acetyltransferase
VSGLPQYVLRAMRMEDIPQVVAIDRQAFPIPWSVNVYRYEIAQNPSSEMVVASLYEPAQEHSSSSSLARFMDRLLRRPSDSGWHRAVVGYSGFWFSGGEAHVSTIATHSAFRGRGLGELLLAGMICRALALDARLLSLEVRVSNAPALALYEKYGFHPAGVKPSYYRDNHEDAYDMRVTVDSAFRALFGQRWAALAERIAFEDAFTVARKPYRRQG